MPSIWNELIAICLSLSVYLRYFEEEPIQHSSHVPSRPRVVYQRFESDNEVLDELSQEDKFLVHWEAIRLCAGTLH